MSQDQESDSNSDGVMVEHDDNDETPELTTEEPVVNKTPESLPRNEETVADAETEAGTKANNATDANKEPDQEESPKDEPQAVNIVSIGTEDEGYAFHYHPERLQAILNQIPANTRLQIVSVVGAFRTGKSFLLSWFLRYLHRKQDSGSDEKWYNQVTELQTEAFHWQAGKERDTTGIWMWNRPILAKDGDYATLLVDTQGMFDHETSMNLTACIFGFSTLLSSYQIYNVDKRIQEDHLQQLALFSEYARTAMKDDDNPNNDQQAPFQVLEFLVRDWQHFDEDDEDNLVALEESMEKYLKQVVAERKNVQDLQETREQILGTFAQMQCYGLCHPGFAVTKKKFTGQADQIEPLFLNLLDHYCQRVFAHNPDNCKQIHGQVITAAEFASYCAAYAELFANGAKFPQAATLLDATATTNTANAKMTALHLYQRTMEQTVGPNCTNYIDPAELRQQHALLRQESVKAFDSKANFGNPKKIEQAKQTLLDELADQFALYESLNQGRNPLLGLEIYIIPILVAVVAYAMRWFTDAACSHNVCRATSDALHHTWAVVMCFLAIVALTKFTQLRALFQRFWEAVRIIMDPAAETAAASSNKSKTD